MKQFIFGSFVGIFLVVSSFFLWLTFQTKPIVIRPGGELIPRPLDTYTIDALRRRTFPFGQITLDEPVATASAYTVYHFHFLVDGKKVTGLAHVPNTTKPVSGYPVIVQFRGYVDRDAYEPGIGTKKSSEVFASNGFLTLAPDFLGYGGGDMPSTDVFEERFQTYTTAIALLKSVMEGADLFMDGDRIGIWGHSNGGQIALTTLEILGLPIPTVLWAPVTKPFPYSILHYTDEASDSGKALRRVLSRFEQTYDTNLYALTNYVDLIQAPLQIHQGSADEAVPQKWTDEFVKLLKDKGKVVSYAVYPGADHNMKGAWNTVVERDLNFFQKYLRE